MSNTQTITTTENENQLNQNQKGIEIKMASYQKISNPLITFLSAVFDEQIPDNFENYKGIHQYQKYINLQETHDFIHEKLGQENGDKFILMLNDGNTYEYFTHPYLSKDLWHLVDKLYGKENDYYRKTLKVLEPSAGTGNLLRAANVKRVTNDDTATVNQKYNLESYAYELNPVNAFILKQTLPDVKFLGNDFLENNLEDDQFDLVVANPPFSKEKIYSEELGKDSLHNQIIFQSLRKLKVGGYMVMIINENFISTMKKLKSKKGSNTLFENHILNSISVIKTDSIPMEFFPDILTQTYFVILQKHDEILPKVKLLEKLTNEKLEALSNNNKNYNNYLQYYYTKKKDVSTPYGKTITLRYFQDNNTISHYTPDPYYYIRNFDYELELPTSLPNTEISYIHNKNNEVTDVKATVNEEENKFTVQLDKGFDLYKSILLEDRTNITQVDTLKNDLKDYILKTLGQYQNLSATMREIADSHIFGDAYKELSEFDSNNQFVNENILNNSLKEENYPLEFISNNVYLLYIHFSSQLSDMDKILNAITATAKKPAEEIVDFLVNNNIIIKTQDGYKDIIKDEILKHTLQKFYYKKELSVEENNLLEKFESAGGIIENKISDQSLIINSEIFNNINVFYIFKSFLSQKYNVIYTDSPLDFKDKFNKTIKTLGYGSAVNELQEIADTNKIAEVFNKIAKNKSLKVNTKDPEFNTIQTKINNDIAAKLQEQYQEYLKEIDGKYEQNDMEFKKIKPFESMINILVKNTLSQYENIFNKTLIKEIDIDKIPFQNKDITLRQHQKSAIATILKQPATLLAHAVGAGKTYEMIFSFEAMQALNQAKRGLFIMPKSLQKPFQAEYKKSFPLTKIIALESKDLNTKNIQKTYLKIIQNNYSAVIVTYEGYENMSNEFIDLTIEEVTRKLISTEGKYAKKALQKQLHDLTEKKAKLATSNDNHRVNLDFDDLNFDVLYLDESHYYKNRVPADSPSDIKGATGSNVNKAEKNHLLTQLMLNKGNKVIWATGTYVSNSINELYVIQETLAPNTLQGLSYKQWLDKFAVVENVTEFAPSGTGFVDVRKITKFKNLTYLLNQLNTFIDFAGAKSLDLNLPKPHYHVVDISANQLQLDLMKEIAERAEDIKQNRVEPYEDNYLKLTSDGKKVGLSLKLYDQDAYKASDTQKPAEVAKNVARIYHETAQERLTQAIFLDLGTSNNSDKFNVYDYIKNMLIELGVDESDIVFANDRDKLKGKAYDNFYESLNTGEKRIIFASTSKGGVGANYQKRLKAIHHVDILWKPSDLIQREGRIIRQGNQNIDVDIFVYLTKDTFDTNLWQKVSGKQTILSQIYEGVPAIDSGEDFTGNESLNYEEILQATISDPSIKRIFELKKEIYNMELLRETSKAQNRKRNLRIKNLTSKIRVKKDTLTKNLTLLKGFQSSSKGIKFVSDQQQERAQELYNTIQKTYTKAKFINTVFADMFKHSYNSDSLKPKLYDEVFVLNGVTFSYNGEILINSELLSYNTYNFKATVNDQIVGSWTFDEYNYKQSSAQLHNLVNQELLMSKITTNIDETKSLYSEYKTLINAHNEEFDETIYQNKIKELSLLTAEKETAA
ncbi:methyltransferase [Lactococcus insecticola]|uniref:Helicase C-terminal domain-containing protein n=1 Tax=Pseudolactococcus insecticola TaxID=2709158 RepID=A0A6A0B7U5_9LACT|nr:DEAD/DEAH box helicase family protein [Lactococcus insecticola]GFH41410.1 hypothetical protein Hs20B_18080 [Lactococcus insecticola]